MNGSSLTAIIGTFLSSIPAFLPFIPAPYGLIASGILNAINSVWHLYQPSPTAPTPVAPPSK